MLDDKSGCYKGFGPLDENAVTIDFPAVPIVCANTRPYLGLLVKGPQKSSSNIS